MSNSWERRYRMDLLIVNLRESSIRGNVLVELNKFIIHQSTEAMRMDLGFHLWNSELTFPILLQEVVAVYPKLLDPTILTMTETTRLCNALNVIQCMASHPDARIGLLRANIPYFLNPFLQVSENVMRLLQGVTLSILNLIAELAKFDESYGQEILLLLLDTQVVHLCLHCILHGHQQIQKVSCNIHTYENLDARERAKILLCSPARFLLVIQVLHQLVDKFTCDEIPCSQQIKCVVQCYLCLSRVAWVGGIYDAVRTYFPQQLIDNTFGNITRDDLEIPNMLHQLVLNLTRQPQTIIGSRSVGKE